MPIRTPRPVDALVLLVVAALFAVAQWHLLQFVLGERYHDTFENAQSTLHGRPYWRVFQSRVLGPYVVQAMTFVWPGFSRCFTLFNIACLTAAGCLSYQSGKLIGGRGGGLIGFFLFQALFALFLNPYIYYVWDSIEIVIFYVFFILVIRRASWQWMVLLFAVAVFNRESALFIALWLMLDPLSRWAVGRAGYGPEEKLDIASIIAGAACMVVGIALIETLRSALLVEELGLRKVVPDSYGLHIFLPIQRNVEDLLTALSFANRELGVIVPAFLAAVVILTVKLALARPAVFLGTALMYLAQLLAIFLVGILFETRVFIDFIPLVTVATVVLTGRENEAAGKAVF